MLNGNELDGLPLTSVQKNKIIQDGKESDPFILVEDNDKNEDKTEESYIIKPLLENKNLENGGSSEANLAYTANREILTRVSNKKSADIESMEYPIMKISNGMD